MSYILEALRKADAERDRGSVPDLHAQLLPQGVSDAQAESARAPLLPWLVVGALLAVVAGGAWFLLGSDASDKMVATSELATSGTLASAVPASTASAPTVPPSAPAAVPAPAPVPVPAEAASAPTPRPRPATTRPSTDVSANAVASRAVARPPTPAPTPPPPPPAAAAPATVPALAPTARLPGLGELPGELRQLLPPLVIGGSVYSPQASARMVIVNGQVFQEGSSLTPELKLEQVRPKAAVFSIRGQLFEVPF